MVKSDKWGETNPHSTFSFCLDSFAADRLGPSALG